MGQAHDALQAEHDGLQAAHASQAKTLQDMSCKAEVSSSIAPLQGWRQAETVQAEHCMGTRPIVAYQLRFLVFSYCKVLH